MRLPAFKAYYGDWQNAGGGNHNTDTAQGHEHGGGSPDVNAVQRCDDVATNSGGVITLGRVTFLRASGPVGEDGRPFVFHHRTRGSIAAFDISHLNENWGWVPSPVNKSVTSQTQLSKNAFQPDKTFHGGARERTLAEGRNVQSDALRCASLFAGWA